MLKFIEEKLSAFKTCFTRTATYRWFVVVIVGLMTRTDFLGVTSLIRCLGIHPGRYESLLYFFRSDAFSTKTLKNTWFQAVLHDHRLTPEPFFLAMAQSSQRKDIICPVSKNNFRNQKILLTPHTSLDICMVALVLL